MLCHKSVFVIGGSHHHNQEVVADFLFAAC